MGSNPMKIWRNGKGGGCSFFHFFIIIVKRCKKEHPPIIYDTLKHDETVIRPTILYTFIDLMYALLASFTKHSNKYFKSISFTKPKDNPLVYYIFILYLIF
jgi:hypothetical protein